MVRVRQEGRALLKQGALMLRGTLRRRTPASGSRVVVCVHGFLAGPAVFDPLCGVLRRELGVSSLSFGYAPVGRFQPIARKLADFVERWVPPQAEVFLVGHSLGGLLARWYVQELGGHTRVGGVITLATPHAGTRSALLAPSAFALRPGSPIIERLAARRSAAQSIPHVTVVAGDDALCRPPSTAAALADAKIIWLDGVAHNELLFDQRMFKAVIDAVGPGQAA